MPHTLPLRRFEAAPWTTVLKVVSSIGTVVLLGVSCALYRAIPHGTRVPFAETFGTLLLFVPFLILVGALLFIVSGYELDASALYVYRLCWRTRIPLDGLERAWHDPAAMCRSFRIFGNGGLFSATGLYQYATLGRYRAFVTDPRQAVVLRLPTRTIVLSPACPRTFLKHLKTIAPAADVIEPTSAINQTTTSP